MDPVLTGFLPVMAWALFAGATTLSIVLGIILYYHWYRYAMNAPLAFVTIATYAGVSGFLLLALLGAAFGVTAIF